MFSTNFIFRQENLVDNQKLDYVSRYETKCHIYCTPVYRTQQSQCASKVRFKNNSGMWNFCKKSRYEKISVKGFVSHIRQCCDMTARLR